MDARLADIIARYVEEMVNAVQAEVRRNVADEVQAIVASMRTGNGKLVAGRGRRAVPGRRRIVPCIAPGCNNPSKGPRFHYLCEKHKDAPKKDYEAWRKAAKEKQAA